MCLLLAGILAFVFLPRLHGTQSGTTEIVNLRQTVESGTVITDDSEVVLALDCGLDSLFGENAGKFIKIFSIHIKTSLKTNRPGFHLTESQPDIVALLIYNFAM